MSMSARTTGSDWLRLGVPCWMSVMEGEIKMMEWTPADERFHVSMVVLLEPRTGEAMSVVFERIQISSRVLCVRHTIVRLVIEEVLGDCPEDGAFRARCHSH